MARYNNIAVFGCKSTTLFLLNALHRSGCKVSHLITIDPLQGEKNEVADYYDLKSEVEAMGIQVYSAKHYALKNDEDQQRINGLNIHLAYVIGWQRLVPEAILDGLAVGAFGMHGSSMNLPLGRGRSPMNWSILEGRKVFYTNLFMYNKGVDSGDVLDTFKFQVTDRDTGETMHYKNLLAMKYLIERNMNNLLNGSFQLQRQRDDLTPTHYPKRTPDDGLIDWTQDVSLIERHIRAVTKPFAGAFTYIGNDKVTIWDAQLFDHDDFGYTNAKEATVLAVFASGKFLVKCFAGLLLVNAYDSPCPISEGVYFSNGSATLKHFPRNHQGFFDMP